MCLLQQHMSLDTLLSHNIFCVVRYIETSERNLLILRYFTGSNVSVLAH